LIRLPANVIKLREAHERATAHLRELTQPPHYLDNLQDVTEATVDAFIGGQPLPSVESVLDAERNARIFDHSLDVARNAAAALDRRVAAALAEHADALIVDVLRPVFDTTVSELHVAYKLLEPFEGAGRGALARPQGRRHRRQPQPHLLQQVLAIVETLSQTEGRTDGQHQEA
jgi:hypothetical protein